MSRGSHPVVAQPATDAAMGLIADLLEQRTGQRLAPSRTWRLDAALKPIMRNLAIETLDELVGRLIAGESSALSDEVVDTLLNQETSFFRDVGVLEHAVDALISFRSMTPVRRTRVWSAGCSTGQEPLSLAILTHERALDEAAIEIVATDVSAGAVARARAARYSQFEIQRGLSVRRMMTWFEGAGADWTARRELVRRVQYRRHNLVVDPPPAGGFDLILCRNVMLYFSPDLRRDVFARLAQALRPGGLLVLGAGETVIGQTDLFAPAEAWRGMYKRTAATP